MPRFLLIPFALVWLLNCGGPTGDANTNGGSQSPSLPAGSMAVTHHPSEAIYTVDLTINGKKFPNVLVDTGSSNLTVFGDSKLCPNCVKDSGITSFEPQTFSSSDPALNNGQQFSIRFGVGSGTIETFPAQVAFSELGQPIGYPLGVYTSGKNLDNVLGLGYASNVVGIAQTTPLPFLDMYVVQNNLANLFTLNLCAAQSGSFMTIGSIPGSIPGDSIHYTPIIPNSLRSTSDFDFYAIAPIAIWTASQDTALAPFPSQSDGYLTMVDSGTSLLYLPDSIIAALAKYYENKSGIPAAFWDLYAPGAATLNSTQFSELEDIQLELPAAQSGQPSFKVSISPSTYTIKSGTIENPVYYSAISKALPLNADASKHLVILGEVLLQNNYAVFDRAKAELGFANNAMLCPKNP